MRLAALCPLLFGCAPALASFTPAHVAPRKHLQVEAGIDVSIPTGTIVDAVEAGETLSRAGSERELTEAEQERLFRAGAALALNPPEQPPIWVVRWVARLATSTCSSASS